MKKTIQEIIALPPVKRGKGKDVLSVLKQRKTIREVGDKKIPLQLLSNLLWAACGVNRKKGPFGIPGLTAASASNSQEIDVYVVFREGTFLYDPFKHRLLQVIEGDLRLLTINKAQEDLLADAPLHFLYVADIHRLSHTKGYQEPGLQDAEVQKSYYFVDTGLIAGNASIYAASVGLVSWFHNCNKTPLRSKLKLSPEQKILFGHTFGYPASKGK
jgi:nitroreductase